MASGQPPSSSPSVKQESPPSPPSGSNAWEGDRMFNIYIHDYCMKRGYERTANVLREEAGIQEDPQPPINAKQGLLFEWWSVFWVLFSAKSSGSGPEDALVYTQYQSQQVANRQAQAQASRVQQHMQGMHRFPNGATGPRPGGQMPNGVPAPNQPGQPPMTNGIPHFPANGAPATNGPAMGTPAQQPMIPNQRQGPGPNPGPGQMRGPNGAPFQSPTMAPQGAGGPPGGQMAGQMGQPQQRLPMQPPGAPGMPGQQQQQAHQPQPFPHLGSQSQPASPAQNNLTSPSPRQMHRQPPGPDIRQLQEKDVNNALMKLETARLAELKQEAGLGNKDLPSMTLEDKQRVIEIARARGLLPPFPRTHQPLAPNAAAGPSNQAQHMLLPNQRPGMNQPPLTQHGLQQQHQQQQRIMKRSSTSPGEDNDQSQNDSSPPANKRPRPSPASDHAQPPMAPMLPFPPNSQHGTPNMQPSHNHAIRPMTGPMPPFPQQGMGPAGMNMPPGMGGPHMNSQMVNAAQNMGMTPQMQQHPFQYRQSMHNLHKNGIQQGGMMMPGNVSSPASADSPFGADGSQSRPGTGQFGGPPGPTSAPGTGPMQNRPLGPPQSKMMLPPQSPSMNAAKPPGNQMKDGQQDGPGMGSSPRNAPTPGQQQQGQPMPGPHSQPGQSAQQPGPQGPNPPPGGPMNPMSAGNTAPPTPANASASIPPPAPANQPPPPSQGPPSAVGQDLPFDQFSMDMGLFDGMSFDGGLQGMDFDGMGFEANNSWDFAL